MKTPPVRWRDAASDASPELREVMDYARSAEPGEARVEALRAAVIAQLPAAGAPPAAPSAAPHTAAAGTGTKLILVSAVAAALGIGGWWIQRDAPARKAPDIRVEAARRELPVPPTQTPPEPAPAPQVEPRPRVTSKVEARAPARPRVAAPAVPEELELLHAARLARRHAPAAALSLLRQHEQDFPASALREEREALMIELLQYFDAAQAAERLRAFERQYPQSPYRAGLRLGP